VRPAVTTLLVLGACATVPYEPARLALDRPLDRSRFELVLDVVRTEYPEIAVDATAFRVQSSWLSCVDRDTPALRRLTLYEDSPGVLAVVVEVRHLHVGTFGGISWSGSHGHAEWEYGLIDEIRRVLGS
jgi:hypothetical protein